MDQVEPDKAFPIGAVCYGSALFGIVPISGL